MVIDEVGPGQLLASDDLEIYCGQIRTRVVEGPRPPILPALVRPIRVGGKIDGYLDVRDAKPLIEEALSVNLDDAIVGRIRSGVLTGSVCGARVRIRVLGSAPNGQVIAVVPVTRLMKAPPRLAIRLLAAPILAAVE